MLQGSFDIVHVKDAVGHTFATRMTNVFVIGKGEKPLISLPKGKGVRCGQQGGGKFGGRPIEKATSAGAGRAWRRGLRMAGRA